MEVPALLTAVHLLAACRDAHDPYTTSQVNETPPEGILSPEQTATTLSPAVATGELKPSEAPTLSNDDSTDLIYDDDADDTLEEHLRSDTQGNDRTSLSVTASQVELLRECLLDEAPLQFSAHSLTERTSVEVMDALGEMAAQTSVEVMAALGEIADALDVAKSQGKGMALQPENEPRKVDDEQLELEDVLGDGSAKVRDRTSPTEDVDDAESHEKGMALLPENSTRRVDDEQLELDDDLGVPSAKVRDRTSFDDHAADPRVDEPSLKEPADESPAIGIKSLNVGGENAKSSQLKRVQRSSQIPYPSLTLSLLADQLERVQRSSQIPYPSLVPSLVSSGQLKRVQRSSQIEDASSGSNLDNQQLGMKLPEQLEDAMRQRSDLAQLGVAAIKLMQMFREEA